MTYITKDDEIVLAVGQTADPGKCGSCHFFSRTDEWRGRDTPNAPFAEALGLHDREHNRYGTCRFKLPPWLSKVFAERPYDEESRPRDEIKDTDCCDLYRHSGLTYIVSERVKPA